MIKFVGGLAIGVLLTIAFCYSDTPEKTGGIVIGTVLGAALVGVAMILLMHSCATAVKPTEPEKTKRKNRDKWWLYGEKPPWEQEDD